MDFNTTIAEKAEEIFFKAMVVNGLANPDIKKTPITGLPGSKSMLFRENYFTVLDYYFVYPDSNKSFGTTLISYSDKPIWIMHYGGWYHKSAIPFLKAVLLSTYRKKEFCGGRGTSPSRKGDLLYINKLERNLFGDFKGREEITDGDGSTRGTHEYFGGFLSSLKK